MTKTISVNNYQLLLQSIKEELKKSEEIIRQNTNKQKLFTFWNIGQIIDQFLRNSTYNENIMNNLAQDTQISKSILYKMRIFFKTYPKLPQNNNLSWSHYRSLLSIKEEEKRIELENLTINQNWNVRKLEKEVKNSNFTQKNDKKPAKPKKLTRSTGQLFTYKIISNPVNEKEKFIDLGFNIFRKFNQEIAPNSIVKSLKNTQDEYSFTEIEKSTRKINIYKASLERIVDGDTLRVILDLGFNNFHRQIIRLKGINAAEKNSKEGQKASQILSQTLKNAPFLIVKTSKIDIYGRYVADIFFENNPNISPQETANNGQFLNQLLVDKGATQII